MASSKMKVIPRAPRSESRWLNFVYICLGTDRQQLLVDGGDGFLKQMFKWVSTDSFMDINFSVDINITCDDWRQAQISIRSNLQN